MNAETLVIWLLVGLIAGWLAGVVMRGGGYGVVGDIVIGIVGAVIGGFLFSVLGLGATGLIGSIVVAFIGAILLIIILRGVAPGRARL
ncbi:MAG: GlsB/YeaQ/YmgE family stress response membrane protein [Rudaea sp.]